MPPITMTNKKPEIVSADEVLVNMVVEAAKAFNEVKQKAQSAGLSFAIHVEDYEMCGRKCGDIIVRSAYRHYDAEIGGFEGR